MAFLEDWIRKTSELEPTTKLLLHTLSSYADAEGVCWPSQATIATAMSMSVATVKRELHKCLELKLLDVRRRWRKSNVYRLLCIKEALPKADLSTMGSPMSQEEQPPCTEMNVCNAVNNSPPIRGVPPREVAVLLEDIGDVLGNTLLEQNRRFYVKVIRSASASYEIIQDALKIARCRILEGELNGNIVHNPSGYFWGVLRTMGVRI